MLFRSYAHREKALYMAVIIVAVVIVDPLVEVDRIVIIDVIEVEVILLIMCPQRRQ